MTSLQSLGDTSITILSTRIEKHSKSDSYLRIIFSARKIMYSKRIIFAHSV